METTGAPARRQELGGHANAQSPRLRLPPQRRDVGSNESHIPTDEYYYDNMNLWNTAPPNREAGSRTTETLRKSRGSSRPPCRALYDWPAHLLGVRHASRFAIWYPVWHGGTATCCVRQSRRILCHRHQMRARPMQHYV